MGGSVLGLFSKTYMLRAKTHAEMQLWMESISAVVREKIARSLNISPDKLVIVPPTILVEKFVGFGIGVISNSLENGLREAKAKGVSAIYLKPGVHKVQVKKNKD